MPPTQVAMRAPACLVEPDEFATDLQRQFARRCDDQSERLLRGRQAIVLEQLAGHGEAEGHRLARAGLRGNHQIAPQRLIIDDRRLDGGQRGIATRCKRS
jgi:hypothetical protein